MPEIGASTTFTFEVTGLSSPTTVMRFDAVEAISALFEVELTLTSEDKDIQFADVIGKPALLTLTTYGSDPRYLQGIVSRFRHADDGKKLSVYHATVVPTLWRLRHRQDSRIFQAKTVPDIVAEVLTGAGISDFRRSLAGTYSLREFCVQYRESDFAFISRLMEEEGIFYYFEHEPQKHTLVLGDRASAVTPMPAPATLPYKTTLGAMAHGESVSRFALTQEVRPGKVTLTDFNFKKPSLALLESSSAEIDLDLEVYDYPGEYEVPGDGSDYAKVRLEEWQARRTLADGESGCVRLTPGYLFDLVDCPRDADNQTYLITFLRQRGSQPQMGEVAAGGDGPSYQNSFQAIPAKVPFRPERVTPRPVVRGAQTAIVTGPSGDEIYTDENGRVKVHFHWDRTGKNDDTSSCWIRVSQLWAGAGWGAMWIPRVGHEVIVDFLEGDPDRPIIVGRVYHGTNVPPYPLPAEKTKSTIKSNSSVGGGGNNELRFEDLKGKEEIWLHGQKDWNIKIEHDKNQLVGHDETKEVGNDETYQIDHDQGLHVKHDRTKRVDNDQSESIGGNKSIDVAKSHTETIGGDETMSVSGNRTVTVSKDHAESIGQNQSIDVGASLSITVGGALSQSVGGAASEQVSKSMALDVGESYALTVAKDGSVKIGKNVREEVGGKKAILVGEEFSVQVGDAVLTLKKNGDISVAGKKITVTGTGPIEVQGSKIQVKSDGDVNVQASGNVKIQGSNVGVN